jgi:hypothetical protein
MSAHVAALASRALKDTLSTHTPAVNCAGSFTFEGVAMMIARLFLLLAVQGLLKHPSKKLACAAGGSTKRPSADCKCTIINQVLPDQAQLGCPCNERVFMTVPLLLGLFGAFLAWRRNGQDRHLHLSILASSFQQLAAADAGGAGAAPLYWPLPPLPVAPGGPAVALLLLGSV